jgi:hypothetical protein
MLISPTPPSVITFGATGRTNDADAGVRGHDPDG